MNRKQRNQKSFKTLTQTSVTQSQSWPEPRFRWGLELSLVRLANPGISFFIRLAERAKDRWRTNETLVGTQKTEEGDLRQPDSNVTTGKSVLKNYEVGLHFTSYIK